MRRNRICMRLIMFLMIGFISQWFLFPAYGTDYFNLSTSAILSEIDLDWTPVSGATSYDIYKSPSKSSKLATVAADTSWYRDYSVVQGKSYSYWIIAKKGDSQLGRSNFSEAVAGGDKCPSIPTLRAKPFADPYVQLSWGGSFNALRYELERKLDKRDFRTLVQMEDETSYKDFYVTPGTTYIYRIRAFNDYGRSAYSSEISVTVKPDGALPDVPAPFAAYDDRVNNSNIAEVESNKSVVLSWYYNDSDAQGFKVERKSSGGEYTEIANIIPGVNNFSSNGTYRCDSSAGTKHHYFDDISISNDSAYYYRIKAYNKNGESAYTNELRVATLVTKEPSPPSNLKAEAVPGKVNLTWNKNSGNEKGFYIERRADFDQSFVQVDSVSAGACLYYDSSYSPNTTYFYRVRAFNDKGTSNYSMEAKVTSQSAPPIKISAAGTGIPKSEKVYILLLYDSPNATSVSSIKFLTIPPVIKSSTIYLPARDIADLLDSKIKWKDSEMKAIFSYHNQTLEVWANRNTACINGLLLAADSDPTVTPFIENQKYLMLPLQLIKKGFKCTIDWKPNDKFITVFASEKSNERVLY